MRSQVLEPDPEKKRSQVASTVAESLLSRAFFEAVPDAMVAVDEHGKIVQINSQTERLFGYTQDELLGQGVEVLVPVGQRDLHHRHRGKFQHRPETRRMGAQVDLRGRRKDGSEFPVEISLSPVATDNGTLVLSAIRDVSARKLIEAQLQRAQDDLNASKDRQLQESQNRLAQIVNSSQDAIIGKTLDGIITHWNKGAEQMYGYTPEEVIGKSISILTPDDRPDEIPDILRKLSLGQRVEYFETTRVTKNGQRLDVSISVSPIRDGLGEIIGASAVARDVTAQKRAEDQLRQAQKLEAMGRLAGGVAHDFNNVLGIVTACCELLRSHLNDDAVQYLDNIGEAARRGSSLTRQLLAFGRRQATSQPRLLDVGDSLKEVVKLLRPLMGDDVEIVVRHSAEPAVVESDPSHLDQVILNLAVNARDAMPKGGKLLLQTSVVEFDAAMAELHPPLKVGRYVLLAISDTGIGMDAATLTRIFEPFFTTKEPGKGTGLGLATVYGIVKQNGGHIWVYSELGHGTTFKIYFPTADHRLDSAPKAAPVALPPRAHGETILLVEDDPLMRALTRQMLQDHGYKVLDAENGTLAFKRLEAHPGTIDLVLTDVVMRGMSGPELTQELARRHPKIKVVFMSGYTGELLEQNGASLNATAMLDKPFTRAQLLKTLHAALRSA